MCLARACRRALELLDPRAERERRGPTPRVPSTRRRYRGGRDGSSVRSGPERGARRALGRRSERARRRAGACRAASVPLASPRCELLVVDDQRLVELLEAARSLGVVRLGHVVRDPLLRVPLERDELRHVLPHAVLERADREVQDLDRVPAAQREQAVAERLVVPATDAHVGHCAMRRLRVRAQRVVDGTRACVAARSSARRRSGSSSGRGTKFRHAPRTTPNARALPRAPP